MVIENVERQKAAREKSLERIRAVGSSRRRLISTTSTTSNGLPNGLDPSILVNGSSTGNENEEGRVEGSRIGERGHLDVDDLVQFIQGPAKSTRGKNSLRGKRRTGAKR